MSPYEYSLRSLSYSWEVSGLDVNKSFRKDKGFDSVLEVSCNG